MCVTGLGILLFCTRMEIASECRGISKSNSDKTISALIFKQNQKSVRVLQAFAVLNFFFFNPVCYLGHILPNPSSLSLTLLSATV